MNLSTKQKDIIEAEENKIVVLASAGSGKTAVLTERVKRLLNEGVEPSGIVVITFTNAAAEEMKERIGEKSKGCFIGTIHSYANFILNASGYETKKYLDNEDFDKLFDAVKKHPSCIRPVEYLLLDEAQDSTDQQFEFILDMVDPDNYFIVGDYRQSIYSFNGANPDYLYELSRKPYVTKYELNENYRNCSNVLSFAKDFLEPLGYKYYDDSRVMSKEFGYVKSIEFRPESIGNEILNSEDKFGDWFVLTRTNAELSEVQSVLEAMGIPCETFKRAELSNKELNQRLKNNTVKVLTIHTSKGLENKNVAVGGAKYFNDEERRVNYVAATRARNVLIWCTTPKRKKKSTYTSLSSWE